MTRLLTLEKYQFSPSAKMSLDIIYCQPMALMARPVYTMSRMTFDNGTMPNKFAKLIDVRALHEYCTGAWSVYLELWSDGTLTIMDVKNRDYMYDEKGKFLG